MYYIALHFWWKSKYGYNLFILTLKVYTVLNQWFYTRFNVEKKSIFIWKAVVT